MVVAPTDPDLIAKVPAPHCGDVNLISKTAPI